MDGPPAHFDDWAEYYDAVQAAADPGDREFYVEEALAADGPVLEVGCGTGRVYLELLRRGVDASGIDASPGMLSVLRDAAAEEGLEPDVRVADMAGFETDRAYALVVVPFRTFLHNLTAADQRATLRRIREALAPDGRLVCNFFAPSYGFICANYGETRATSFEHGGRTLRQESVSTFADEIDRVVRVENRIYDGAELLAESSFRIRLVTKPEFDLLLEVTGFSDWSVYGGFDREPLESADQEMVWVAER